ncbi:MAG: response regulator transcription factor [Saprospiraceae bacterium]|nr:response regulator transcription factor [Saprospiraceae bacterium]
MLDTKRVLLVEDDLNLGFLLVELLEEAGYQVKLCKDAQMAWQTLQRTTFDLCLLDVTMPGMDGFGLAEKLKQAEFDMPFLFLTAKSRKEDKLKGYACGAEDYITKPFDEDELLCKLEVIFRRKPEDKKVPKVYQIGTYRFNPQMQELSCDKETKRMTEKETEILMLLCQNKNQILRRDEAVEQVYGRRDYFLGRSFDVFISRLRKLLQNDPNISIENVFRVGFILKVAD